MYVVLITFLVLPGGGLDWAFNPYTSSYIRGSIKKLIVFELNNKKFENYNYRLFMLTIHFGLTKFLICVGNIEQWK